MRERHAFITAKLWDLAVSAPYAETSTEDLRTRLEDAELEPEELLPLMRAALADRANGPALARKMEREFDDLAQGVAGLRTELDTRQLQDANDVLARHRASVVAEREIRQTDVDALAGLQDDWRRAKAKERLTETFEGRLAKHTGIVHERLLAEADAKGRGAAALARPRTHRASGVSRRRRMSRWATAISASSDSRSRQYGGSTRPGATCRNMTSV
jgi:hypothetical protein